MTITWDLVAQVANNLTVIALLILIIVTGAKGVWVFTIQSERMLLQQKFVAESAEKREQWWKDAFFRLADVHGVTANVALALKDEVAKKNGG